MAMCLLCSWLHLQLACICAVKTCSHLLVSLQLRLQADSHCRASTEPVHALHAGRRQM